MPRVLIATLGAATLMLFLGPKFIAWLRANEVGQFVRPQGLIPDAHAEKQGTPTMGGLLILLATTIPFVIVSTRSTLSMLVLFVTLGCGLIGFLDDFTKIVRRRSLGLSGRIRILGLRTTWSYSATMFTRSRKTALIASCQDHSDKG